MQYPSIFSIKTPQRFQEAALRTFQFQFEQVPVYRRFCELLGVKKQEVKDIDHIPFLPIELFKSHRIHIASEAPQIIFRSSGTTGSSPSEHLVTDISLYEESFRTAFASFYGDPSQYTILALLPSYLERGDSSLIYMVDHLIAASASEHSGFYLNDLSALIDKLEWLERQQKPTILIGVSYALLDLIEQKQFQLQHTIVMETGGMKGRRKELVRKELHALLKKGFGVTTIHSEYGMTELLSQAYSKGDGIFTTPPWMRVRTRETEDPFAYLTQKTGGINVIDLANQNSCAFIATQDLGRVYENNSFEVLGRFDHSDVRGCNLMVM
ncbi:acyl transferase [Altibacter sp. HG106]|uniref:acyl transferase n=1 Tax=Altibacter sp. HG106 TaxID=3023937 RepID=UPI002350CA8E|nr:acyl transferase [Altibacter sp. HG106]MDC7995267.1 acyl transferase [Altibacter sp. HG106]